MSAITTHILDLAAGRPATGVEVTLSKKSEGQWAQLGAGKTNSDGRVTDLLASDHALQAGTYQLTFNTGEYLHSHDRAVFFPEVSIAFEIEATTEHYHVPLLLSDFGYSTYRGS